MGDGTVTLTDFLLARIADDEAVAHYATTRGAPTDEDFAGWWIGHYDHANRHSPARVLAECEAKRRIVEEVTRGLKYDVACGEGHHGNFERIFRALALPHADHLDYRDEWRP